MRSIKRALGVSTILGGALAMAMVLPGTGHAADHGDSPAAGADPAADIADIFAWTDAGGTQLNLVMTFAGTTPSDGVQYVFHVSSGAALSASTVDYSILCEFDAAGEASCWAGDDDDFVGGDISDPAGTLGVEGKMRAYWGERNDPFFFNITGFLEVLSIVKTEADAGNLVFDAALCPAIDMATSNVLVGQLSTEPGGGPAVDDFANNSVGALVVQIDLDLVNAGGDILGVWGATYSN